MDKNYRGLEQKMGYSFTDKGLLKEALTHSSYAHENKAQAGCSNERLEFLGDAVLGLIVSEYIFTHYPLLAEGDMTKARAAVVCESSLCAAAFQLGLSKYLVLGKGEKLSGGAARPSLLADAHEALTGAVYLDGGFKKVKKYILRYIEGAIQDSVNAIGSGDYKTQLQEELQKRGSARISYQVTAEEGPDHDKVFGVQVRWGRAVLGKGRGKSKKEAEQMAAQRALKQLL